MAKYQLKPYVIEAEQFTGPDSLEKIMGLCKKVPDTTYLNLEHDDLLVIDTGHDFNYVYEGDYVVLDGEILITVYRERFERNYTLV